MKKQLIVFLTFFVPSLFEASGCPHVISRAQWSARPTKWTTNRKVPVQFVVIHHSAGSECSYQGRCTAVVRSIQNYHMDTNKWGDVGYNFLIGGDGSVYEGRGWHRVGAHAINYNSNGVGICFLGNFQGRASTAAAIASAKRLIKCGVKTKKILDRYKLIGHRQANPTACPGNTLYNLITKWKKLDKKALKSFSLRKRCFFNQISATDKFEVFDMKEDDGRILICYSRKLLILMKVSGALPMNPRNTFLRLMSQLYIAITAICYAHTIFETLLYFFINAEKTQVLLRGLWIKGSLLIYVLQILGFLMKRKDVHEILHSCPEVIKENFGTVLKMYMRKARRLCYLIVWLYMLISAAVSIALENRNYFFNDPEEEKATIERAENKSEDFIAQYLSPTLASVFFALNGYVQIFVHTSLGLFQLSYAMIYFHICCFIQGYADHLVDSMSELVITTEKSSENRIWPSSINPEKVDVRYIATLHQYILKYAARPGIFVAIN
ncbi:Hypothetical predicted protein [Cloeon dipterum]|uniref:Peptidoglycan recognition protein family domain-containing protein n=1 Tax=Cloeon dipterum TaxID=197152 RepID=A0A8S1BVR9_9INSE|nr:Hypothetical predicted protein [Cloeon dipterum]